MYVDNDTKKEILPQNILLNNKALRTTLCLAIFFFLLYTQSQSEHI